MEYVQWTPVWIPLNKRGLTWLQAHWRTGGWHIVGVYEDGMYIATTDSLCWVLHPCTTQTYCLLPLEHSGQHRGLQWPEGGTEVWG